MNTIKKNPDNSASRWVKLLWGRQSECKHLAMGFGFEDVQAESINYNKLCFGSQIF